MNMGERGRDRLICSTGPSAYENGLNGGQNGGRSRGRSLATGNNAMISLEQNGHTNNGALRLASDLRGSQASILMHRIEEEEIAR